VYYLFKTVGTIDQSKLDSQLGQASGIKSNIDAGVNYAQNTMYGEMSNQQSTKAKLDAQGGVGGAVGVDVLDSSIKAKTQKDVLDEQLKNSGALKGLDDSAKNLEKAADKLAQTAGTMAGGKTASDIAAVDKYDSPEQYAQAQAQKASSQAAVDKTRLEKSLDQEITQKKLDAMRKGVNNKELFDQQAIKAGIAIRGKNGELIATKGSQFTDGLSALGAGDMASTSQLIIGDERMNVDTDIDGNAFVNRDSQENTKRGRTSNYGISGYPEHWFGGAGEAMMFGLTGLAGAEVLSRKFGMKNGVVKPAFNKFADFVDPEGSIRDKFSGNSSDNTPDSTGNSDNSKPANSSESQKQNRVHENSSKRNFGGGPAHQTYSEYKKSLPNKWDGVKDFAKKGVKNVVEINRADSL
jgi:hypothetical protein